MQQESPKINLYEQRGFGQNLSATLDFLRENFKPWLRACVYLLLPLSLIQSLSLNTMMDVVLGNAKRMATLNPAMDFTPYTKIIASYLGLIACVLVGTVLLTSLCYALMQRYQDSDSRLRGVTMTDLKPLILCNVKRTLIVALTLGFLGIILGIVLSMFSLAMHSFLFAFLIILGFGFLMIPLSLTMPVYVFESGQTVFEAIASAFWPLLGLLIVIVILANILQLVITLPWYFAVVMRTVMTVEDNGSSAAGLSVFSFVQYLLGVIQAFGSYLTMSLTVVALAYQYGSVAEKQDTLSVENDIERFERLADDHRDADFDDFDKL